MKIMIQESSACLLMKMAADGGMSRIQGGEGIRGEARPRGHQRERGPEHRWRVSFVGGEGFPFHWCEKEEKVKHRQDVHECGKRIEGVPSSDLCFSMKQEMSFC